MTVAIRGRAVLGQEPVIEGEVDRSNSRQSCIGTGTCFGRRVNTVAIRGRAVLGQGLHFRRWGKTVAIRGRALLGQGLNFRRRG